MAAGVVQVPWYATVFRGDKFQVALEEIAPVALRYGATDYRVYRSRDDMYKFLQMATFEEKVGWETYWYGPEFEAFRAQYASWYQVPIVYEWHDRIVLGALQPEAIAAVNGD